MSGWTEERESLLRKLVAEDMTASQIAREMGGLSRSAVIGKAYRLGLMLGNRRGTNGVTRKVGATKAQRAYRPRPTRLKPPERTREPDPEPIFAEPIPAYTGTPLSILECSDLRCRYPVRDDPFGACGTPVKPGKPYCAHHAARCFIPLDDRKKRISRLADLVDAEHSAKRVRA